MRQRNLLLCFDAFGTLFKPRRPIPEQYAAVARQCGLDVDIDQLEASFKVALSGEAKAHPNYGRASGMGAKKWWTNVIHKTFQPLSNRALPKDLAPRLLHRFSTSEGYTLAPGLPSLLRSLKQQSGATTHPYRIVVGVITNSDDRVPGILSSFGLRISPFRFGSHINLNEVVEQQYDIDFHCMSYDVGFAKPDRRIFNAAEAMFKRLIAAHDDAKPGPGSGRVDEDAPWLKLYVGDELDKDGKGACDAGWSSVVVQLSGANIERQEKVLDLHQCGTATLDDVFPRGGSPTMIQAESVQMLVEWLIQQSAGKYGELS